ncbi:hypothetical protein AB0B63_10350 [Micromonospora sp. NPDC049081]|uniref:hypothetical protein n=1 Tax=Micromonospora sp. NPDC049081 TaxID=3155150 RepID=UPI0033FA4539
MQVRRDAQVRRGVHVGAGVRIGRWDRMGVGRPVVQLAGAGVRYGCRPRGGTPLGPLGE